MHKMLFLASVLLSLPLVAQAAEGNAARGKTLFMSDGCYECHGTVAQGGDGKRLAPNPPSVDTIAAYIRHPLGVMPPYAAKVVSDADIIDIHAYLQSIPPSPKLSAIPELAPGPAPTH